MCRLFWTLNNIKSYKALNLQSIPTLTNILLCLIWENHVTWKTEILGSHRYVNSPALNRCHLHFETLTRMKISVSFYLHFIPPYLSSKKIFPPQKQQRRNKNKAPFTEKKVCGKTLLYQQSLKHLKTLYNISLLSLFFFISLLSLLYV